MCVSKRLSSSNLTSGVLVYSMNFFTSGLTIPGTLEVFLELIIQETTIKAAKKILKRVLAEILAFFY